MNGSLYEQIIDNHISNIDKLEKDMIKLKEEFVEMILLDDLPKQIDVYTMTYEQQAELPKNARL